MNDERCGCCEGVEKVTPLPRANRPGLTALTYRIGTHATFFETMKACLSTLCLSDEDDCRDGGLRPLQGLTTRESDDPAIALLDGWATVADVLCFYQERIANEGYLLTATERRSVLELARLVGYTLRPGVAASVYLAFTLEKDYKIEIPQGTRGQSIPDPGELPQAFETVEAISARTEWNAIKPRQSRPQYLVPDATFTGERSLLLNGIATNLKANNVILFVCGRTAQAYQVSAVETNTEDDFTTAAYRPLRAPLITPTVKSLPPPQNTPPLTRLSAVIDSLKVKPSLPPANRFRLSRPLSQSFNAASDLGPQLLVNLNPILKNTLYSAYAQAPVTGVDATDLCSIEAARVKAAPFGHNAPQDLVYDANNTLVGRREWALAEFDATLDLQVASTDPTQSVGHAFTQLFDLAGGSFPPLSIAFSITDVLGAEAGGPIALSDLIEVTPPNPSEPIYQRELTIRGVLVTIRAEYEQEGSAWFLQNVLVFFTSGGQTRSVRFRDAIHVGSTIPPGSSLPLSVEVTGLSVQTVNPGTPVIQDLPDTNRQVRIALNGDLRVIQQESLFATSETIRILTLDAPFEEITVGSWVVIDRIDAPQPITTRIERVQTLSRADYGITAKVTQLVLEQPWLLNTDTSLAVLRGTTVYAQSEALGQAEIKIDDDVKGSTIELDGLYDGLEAGRWIVVKGLRTDIATLGDEKEDGVEGSELAMLAGVTHDVYKVEDANGNLMDLPGDLLHTTLTLSTDLAYTYRRETVTLNANVAKATHGETREEVLGSGDGSKALQQFTLSHTPLTYLAAATPAGAESTLEVRVNDIEWHEESSLIWLDSASRGFSTQTDDDAKTTVIFGDGTHGARLPTAPQNVKAIYRSGLGKIGNVDAERISQLATKPLGVKEVINPQAATGGADAESRDQARRNAPLAVMALDRLVSVQDYADFARTFAGIAKASATQLSDGRRTLVYLTIAGLDDIAIEAHSDLYRNLCQALHRYGDPRLPVQVVMREVMFLFISARVGLLPDYQWESVEPKVRAALLDVFSFERRDLGQDVPLSEVISTIQAVEGVCYVDVDLLESLSESEAEDAEKLAKKLEMVAAAGTATATCEDQSNRPRERIVVQMARVEPDPEDPTRRVLRRAQLAYLNPHVSDTLSLTEVAS